MVIVINLKYCKDWGKPGDVLIDRRSKWGNPFEIGKDGDRYTVCEKYKIWVNKQFHEGKLNINELLNAKRIGCWCVPKQCHGHYLKQRIDELNNQTLNKWCDENDYY